MIANPNLKAALRAELTSNTTSLNELKKSYFTCKMSFKYYMNVNPSNRNSVFFTVNVGPKSYSKSTVWRTTAQVSQQWIEAQVAIGEQV